MAKRKDIIKRLPKELSFLAGLSMRQLLNSYTKDRLLWKYKGLFGLKKSWTKKKMIDIIIKNKHLLRD